MNIFCAVNVFGWAYADTPAEAIRRLAESTGNESLAEQKKKYLLRVFEFQSRPKGWCYYCPTGLPDGEAYWLLEDNMRDYGDDVKFPIQLNA